MNVEIVCEKNCFRMGIGSIIIGAESTHASMTLEIPRET